MESKKNESVDNERLQWPLKLIGLLFISGVVLASFTFETPVYEEKLSDLASSGDSSTIETEEEPEPPKQEEQPEEQVEATPPPQEEVKVEENKEEKPKAAVAPPPPPKIKVDKKPVKKAEIIEFPDVEASFPGGAAALNKFIVSNIQYPETSIDMEEQGKVYLSFVVEPDGSITGVKVERGVSRDLDREAKRVVRAMPKWEPGEAGGKKVRTRCRLPIVFTLN
jgi:protein TonB